MMSVVGIDIGIQRASVDYDCDVVTSLARIYSMRSEIPDRSLWPAPAAPSLRRGVRWVSMASRVSCEIVMPRRSAS